MSGSSWSRLLSLALGVFLVANGCIVAIRPPAATTQDDLQKQQKAIVLLRLKAAVDGQPYDKPFLIRDLQFARPTAWEIKIIGVSIDTGRPLEAIPVSPTTLAMDQGWIYLTLGPGSYYLAVERAGKKATPDYRLIVPEGKSLLYAGTLTFSCKGKWSIGGTVPGECLKVVLSDEGKTAKKQAQTYFGQYGPAATVLLQDYGAMVQASRRILFPMGLVTAATKDIVSPDWTKRGITRTTGIGEVPGDQIARGILDWQWIGMAYLLYLPVGATIGAISGKVAESKWRPCLKDLGKEIAKIEPAAMLNQKLILELTKYGGSQPVALPPGDFSREAARHGLKTLLQAEIQRIQLRECQERCTFCIELALRARLWEANRHTLLQEKILLYSNLPTYRPYSETRPYEVASWASSPCRRMEVYCGPEGNQVLRQEITTGLDSLVEKLCFELGLLSR
jgi:hypothetical protein